MGARLPRLIAISRRAALPGGRMDDWLRALGGAGVDGVQLREKDLDDRALWELACRARELLPAPTRLLVNGRVDVALAAGADGVHLPSTGLPVAAIRRRFGPELLIGRSTHRPGEIEIARREGADYVVFGPVWETPGKERYGPPAGVEGLAAAARLGLPVFALGGITIERLEQAAAAGAAGVAGIRLFLETDRLPRLAQLAESLFERP